MLYLYLLIIIFITKSQCYQGFISLSGKLECNGKPWKMDKVSVYESNFILPDTLLNYNSTDDNGNFVIFASGYDYYPLRPYLYLPNYCNAEVFLEKEWAQYLRVRIPDFYIATNKQENSETLGIMMDFGVIELSEVSSEQIGFQKFTDLVRNFAESRWVKQKKERKTKMSEI